MLTVNRLNLRLNFGEKVDLDFNTLNQVCEVLSKTVDLSICKPLAWKDANYWPDDTEGVSTVSQFFAVGNSINFRYWWIDDKGEFNYSQGKKSGSMERGAKYMWRSLRMCQKSNLFPLLNAKKLSTITLEDVRRIFRDDEGRDVMPALKERMLNWRDLGNKLVEYWDGQFHNLVKEAGDSLFDFVEYSRQFRAFDDPLCKMVMVNAIMHQGRGIAKFHDGIFPGIDYQLLKQQMRIGIIVPKRDLKKKLVHTKLLGRKEARELRNAGLRSFLHIMEKTSIPGDIVDNIWWTNRKKCAALKPECEKCLFNDVCKKKTEYGIPLEATRYY